MAPDWPPRRFRSRGKDERLAVQTCSGRDDDPKHTAYLFVRSEGRHTMLGRSAGSYVQVVFLVSHEWPQLGRESFNQHEPFTITILGMLWQMSSNKSFDAETHRQGAASRAREHTSCVALPVRAGQLRR